MQALYPSSPWFPPIGPRRRTFESALNDVTYEHGRPITLFEYHGKPNPGEFKPRHADPDIPRDV